MRIVTYNVEYCEGINKRWKYYIELQKYFRIVKKTLLKITDYLEEVNPDILALIEIDSGSIRVQKLSGAQLFAEKLGMKYCVEKVKYSRKSAYKLLNYLPIVRKLANAILSKKPLKKTKYHYLSKGVKRLVIQSTIEVDGKELDLFAVHLAVRKKTRVKQLKELASIVNQSSNPKIVFGDFNIFKGLSELEYFLKKTNMLNAAEDRDVKTYPSWKPKHHLDHILISQEIKVNSYEVLNIDYSDHLPVLLDFELE